MTPGGQHVFAQEMSRFPPIGLDQTYTVYPRAAKWRALGDPKTQLALRVRTVTMHATCTTCLGDLGWYWAGERMTFSARNQLLKLELRKGAGRWFVELVEFRV